MRRDRREGPILFLRAATVYGMLRRFPLLCAYNIPGKQPISMLRGFRRARGSRFRIVRTAGRISVYSLRRPHGGYYGSEPLSVFTCNTETRWEK